MPPPSLQGVGSLDVLPEVVETVSGQAKVIVDGGFCRGTDIAKALALGADCVALGRLTGLALAAGGEPGTIETQSVETSTHQQSAMLYYGVQCYSALKRDVLLHGRLQLWCGRWTCLRKNSGLHLACSDARRSAS